MLKIISGGMGSNKTDIVTYEIKKAVLSGENVIVIVPDQYSFEYDKQLYDELGAKDFNKLRTLGFNRFAEIILKEYGTSSGVLADKNSKLISMFKAVKALKTSGLGNRNYYSHSLDKPKFISDTISLIDDLKKSNIDNNTLESMLSQTDGSLFEKLDSISKLFKLYQEELSSAGFTDEATAISEAASIAHDKGFFKDKVVFIHEFSSFTADEYEVIKVILSDAKNLTVSLIIGNGNNLTSNMSPFSLSIKTKSVLIDLAGGKGKVENISADEHIEYKSKAISHLEANLFCLVNNPCDSSEGIRLACAKNPYDEIDYVASSIRKLVRENGYFYKDIAVISRSLDDYSSIIESSFKRYEIPFFMDRRKSVLRSSLVIYVLSLLDCVMTKKYKTENILKYIKSPLSSIEDFKAAAIEEYCYKWNVEGDMWLSDFIPFDNKKGGNPKEFLSLINDIRKKIIEPLESFKQKTKNTTAGEICLALNELLGKAELSEKTFSLISKSIESDDASIMEIARDFKQLWSLFLSAVNSIYKNMGDEKISLRQFYNLLKLMISEMTISSPPQKLDAVTVAKAEHSRLRSMKAVFVIGLNDGNFPKNIQNSGLLTEREKLKLSDLGININRNIQTLLDNERLISYIALTSASEKLTASYHEASVKNEALRPSLLCRDIEKIFGDNVKVNVSDLSQTFFCENEESAYYSFTMNYNSDSPEQESIREALCSKEEYKSKIDFLNKLSNNENNSEYRLSEDLAKSVFFPHDINMSATRADDFYKCPFNYFCKNGLKIYPLEKVDISPMTKGSLIHFILQNILSFVDEKGNRCFNDNYDNLTDNEIKELIHKYCEEYVNSEWGGAYGKTSRFSYNLRNLEKTAFYVVKNLFEELKGCFFKPVAFEYDLSDENGESILKIKAGGDINICMRGSIDRVDLYTDENGNRFVRVVDYKTGGKDFDLASLYHGLNMQMLIYLLALVDTDNEFNRDGKLSPAGVMYMPAKYVENVVLRDKLKFKSEDEREEILNNKINTSFKRKGLLVNNNLTLKAMDERVSGLFAPVKKTSKGESVDEKQVVAPEIFEAIEAFSKDKIIEMGKSLAHGEISAMPVMKSGNMDSISCKYCNYWSVCGKYNRKDAKQIFAEDKEKFLGELEQSLQKNFAESEKDGSQSESASSIDENFQYSLLDD